MKQIPLPIGVEAVCTFDNFLPGANGLTVKQLLALEPLRAPVYFWGACGSGKTHLLKALAFQYQNQGLLTGWFSARDPAPWAFDERWALIVIDGCDVLSADQQHAAFTMFVEGLSRGVPVVAAGRLPPVDLPLREDLRTRLAWGHVFALEPLGEPEVRAVLRREADRRGVFLSDEVMGYLLTHFARDLQYLMRQLDRLDEFSLASKRGISVPLLKQMLVEEGAA